MFCSVFFSVYTLSLITPFCWSICMRCASYFPSTHTPHTLLHISPLQALNSYSERQTRRRQQFQPIQQHTDRMLRLSNEVAASSPRHIIGRRNLVPVVGVPNRVAANAFVCESNWIHVPSSSLHHHRRGCTKTNGSHSNRAMLVHFINT